MRYCMRQIGDLMKDLGFNAEAPIETQKAFIRHLIRRANETSRERPSPILKQEEPKGPEEGQLSFDPKILGICGGT
jgi:hypothetical protein